MKYTKFEKLAKPGRIVPVFRRMNADFLTPVMAYLKIRKELQYSFLLESVLKGQQLGRYSFIGCSPVDSVEVPPSQHNNNGSDQNNFFTRLQKKLDQYESMHVDELPRFTGGAVGFIGYDMIRQVEVLPHPKPDTIYTPEAVMAFYHDLIAFDHLKNQVILIANATIGKNSNLQNLYNETIGRLDKIANILKSPLNLNLHFSADQNQIKSNFSKNGYENIVNKAKEYIFAGDIFQVVLSQRMEIPYEGDTFQIYRTLRNINPSPYLFYLDFCDYQLIGSSPEPLIRVENEEAEIIPIAGTRPRGKNPQEDHNLSNGLLQDPKELAEHVMLVDLARNDMARVSDHGSVKVKDFQTVEYYSHVMHIISRVTGKLNKKHDAVDAFKSAFPAGTVSGAPKIRAMEIINELEPTKRGFYAGAIGYFDYCGNMDMCITIRTLLAKDGKIYFQAGAGIVADSIPKNEYQETINKMNALKSAIEQASGGIDDFIY